MASCESQRRTTCPRGPHGQRGRYITEVTGSHALSHCLAEGMSVLPSHVPSGMLGFGKLSLSYFI